MVKFTCEAVVSIHGLGLAVDCGDLVLPFVIPRPYQPFPGACLRVEAGQEGLESVVTFYECVTKIGAAPFAGIPVTDFSVSKLEDYIILVKYFCINEFGGLHGKSQKEGRYKDRNSGTHKVHSKFCHNIRNYLYIWETINMMKRFLTLVAVSLLLASCGSLNTTRLMQGAAYATQALTLPESDVISYVQQYITQLDAQSKVLPETNAYTKRLRNLTSKLTQVGDIQLNYKVYQDSEVNAFACADGSVRVYTGIMDVMNDEQLLSVIAHEIGHVALKHTYNQMRNSMLTSAAFEGLAATSDKVAVLTDSQLGAIGQTMINNHFSKKQESQADEFSYEFLVASKRNPWVMVEAFEKLQQVSGGSSVMGPVSSLFSTHPDTATRIKTISKLCERDGFTRP